MGSALTRRALLLGCASTLAGCTLPWQQPAQRTGPVADPTATPIRFGPLVLRLVITPEGVPGLDTAVREAATEASRQAGGTADIQDLQAFLGPDSSVVHRLLVGVQAGVPPHAVLLLGRQAQTARLRAMALAQDLSGLMRQVWRRYGGEPQLLEPFHIVEGSWVAAPHYQRLVGNWVRGGPFRALGVDLLTADPLSGPLGSLMGLRQMVQQTARTPAGRPWGIGSALTDDTDAWVWSVIHSWGGGLASLKGDRVELATPQSAGAFSWLAETFGVPPWREAVHAHGAVWSDTEKNEALVAGETAYTFSERLLPPAGALGGSATAAPDLIYLPMPAGPASRPRAIAGSVTHWVLPRGAAADPVERFLEALLQPEAQRRVWRGGGGLALPAFTTGWDDPQLGQLLAAAHPAAAINARRFRQEQTSGGYVSATGNAGGETAASQATGEVRLGAWMLRQVLEGRQPADVLADASRQAIALFRDFGLLGA